MSPEELEAIMADIASANTRYGKRVDRIRERIRKMRSVIIQQKAQIETLKEKLIEIIADDLAEIPISHLKNKHEAQEWRDKARQQLKADPDLAGVEWE